MIEIYRDRDYTKVGLYQGILESYGIKAEIGNRNAVSMTTEVPIPDMFPFLYVFKQEDAQKALKVITEQQTLGESSEFSEWSCAKCGETNEGQFGECWSCQEPGTNM